VTGQGSGRAIGRRDHWLGGFSAARARSELAARRKGTAVVFFER